MGKLYIGIDPGRVGFVTAQKDGKFSFIPLDGCDFAALYDRFSEWRAANDEAVCVIEDVHAIYGSAAEATFNFGYVCGMLKMLLISTRIPYVMVQPKEWQKEMWSNADIVSHKETIKRKDGKEIVKTVVDTKATSMNAAKRLFPTIDFRKNTDEKSRCRKLDDNKVDSCLLSEYARRKNY